jgi:serine/threonine protein kinase/tetratricopeptide (TPR) repeat protein
MSENFDKLRDIFLAALDQPADQRDAYLGQVCAGDADLRRNVDVMLKAHAAGEGPLDRGPLREERTGAYEPGPEGASTVIGPYKLLQQLGEGGMGTVFMAEQTQPVHRKVALKVIKPGMDSRQVVARFEAERQALAMMDHVNIARVFDGGTTENGRPYFVMELVHGIPITKYCDDNHLPPRERLELFVAVCEAIQHAHQKGIIHRDIKPSNVMVTLYDGKPVPKVIDFGVAKATEQKLTERTLFTQYGTMVGTLEYMSPEQAEMSALGVDTRSDIYSLGVLLYELLTGSTPLTHKRMKEAAYAEILRMIKEEEPPKPSTRLSDSGEALASISANRHTEPAKLTKLVRGELDWIVMKCLEKDRNRRYETASGFAADVQRYLSDEPVQACPPSAGYRFKKFMRRNKGPLTAAAVVFLVMFGGIVATTWMMLWARNAEGRARAEEAKAVIERDEKEKARAAEERHRNEAADLAVRWLLHKADENDQRMGSVAFLAQALQILPQNRPELELYIRRALTLRGRWQAFGHFSSPPNRIEGEVLAVSPDGKQLVVSDLDHSALRLMPANGGEFRPLEIPPMAGKVKLGGRVFRFSPDGRFIVATTQLEKSTPTYLWKTCDGRIVGKVPVEEEPELLEFSSDGKQFATRAVAGFDLMIPLTIPIFHTESLQPITTVRSPSPVETIRFHSDGRSLWTVEFNGTVRRWCTEDGTQIGMPWVFPADTKVAMSRDGRIAMVAAPNLEVRVFDVESREPIGSAMKRRYQTVACLDVAPNGRKGLVVSLSDTNSGGHGRLIDEPNGVLEVLVFESGKVQTEPVAAGDPAMSIGGGAQFNPDGQFINCSFFPGAPSYPGIFDPKAGRWLMRVGAYVRQMDSTDGSPIWMPDGQSLWWGGERFSIEPFPGDASLAKLWAEVAGFHELSRDDELLPLDYATWEARRQSLEEKLRGMRVPAPVVNAIAERRRWLWWKIDSLTNAYRNEEAIPFHDMLRKLDPSLGVRYNRAMCLLNAGRFEAAIPEFDAFISQGLFPGNIELFKSRSRAFAGLGRWGDAIRDLNEYRQALLKLPFDESNAGQRNSYALIDVGNQLSYLHLANGDTAGYRKICAETLTLLKARKSLNANRKLVEDVLWVGALVPGDPMNLKALAPLIELPRSSKGLRFGGGTPLYFYRIGKFQEAIDHASHTRILDMADSVSTAMIRAMATLQLGRKDDAKAALERLQAVKDRYRSMGWDWQRELGWRLLQKELDALKTK